MFINFTTIFSPSLSRKSIYILNKLDRSDDCITTAAGTGTDNRFYCESAKISQTIHAYRDICLITDGIMDD